MKMDRGGFFGLSLLSFILSSGANAQNYKAPDAMQPATMAAERLNELGQENGALARLAGLWDVVETVWATPKSAPVVMKGLIAERKMIGSILQETLRSASDPSENALRIDYLSFNRVEGRWEYVSMDFRAAVGIMTAQSVGREKDDDITLIFQPLALAGSGQAASGQMLRIRQQIIGEDPGRNHKDQYFTLADGTSTEWLAHRYAYVARSR